MSKASAAGRMACAALPLADDNIEVGPDELRQSHPTPPSLMMVIAVGDPLTSR